jgi:pimeloyl-ACP methyl ester carboxylesterase
VSTEQDVTFQSRSLHLAGTLMLPDGEGPWPAVLLIPGSGMVDRDENAKRLAIDALGQLARYLGDRGVATLRYDKAGVGASEGDYFQTGFFDHVDDAFSALAYLKSRAEIRPDFTFLLGHSEGALIATRMAGTGADVAGVILLAGSARPGEDLMHWQLLQVVKGMHGLNKWLIDLLHIDVAKSQAKQLDKIKRSTKNVYRAQLFAKINAKWMREFLAYDPAADMPNIHVPVLAITGSKDIQVDPADLDRMAELVPADVEKHEVSDVTHLLRAEPGEPSLSTYKAQAQQPVDGRILSLIGTWLKEHVPASVSAAIRV